MPDTTPSGDARADGGVTDARGDRARASSIDAAPSVAPQGDSERERQRLQALTDAVLLDTPPEEPFDRLTRIAAKLLKAPVALVSLVDDHRQFFKSAVGLPEPWATTRETPLSHSFCKLVVNDGEPLVVCDSHSDARVCDNGAVQDLGVVAYLGVPLRTPGGHVLGSFCVIDTEPRGWSEDDTELLEELSRSIATEIQLRQQLLGERQRVTAAKVESDSAAERMRALASEHNFVEGLLEQMPAAVFLVDAADLKMLRVNRKGLEFFPELADNPILPELGSLVRREDGVDYAPDEYPVVRVIRTGLPVVGEELFLTDANGNEVCILVDAAPLRDATGRIVAGIATAVDITERKELAAARDRVILQEMEARAEQERLTEALTVSNRNKDEFLATLAHELRNPFAPIKTGVELLRRGNDLDDEEREELLDTMAEQTGQILRLIDDLLDVARIRQGKINVRREPLDLCDVLRQALHAVSDRADALDQQLTADFGRQSLPVLGDRLRLVQVISNLLHNACKYTPAGGEIDLTATRNGGVVRVVISDSGRGLSAEDQQRIFDLFEQLDDDIGPARDGLGIGLTLARRLVRLHEGQISVESEGHGLGSTFTIELPTAADAELPAADAPADDTLPVTPRDVLVVEDTPAVGFVFRKLLESLGHSVTLTTSAREALDYLESRRPEIIFSDVSMPEMDGLEFARRVRADDRISDLRLVALTGHGRDSDRERTRAAGFDEHVVKPADIRLLRELFHRFDAGPTPTH